MGKARFTKGSIGRTGGCYICTSCGKRTRETGDDESLHEICRRCNREAEMENMHSDLGHGGPVEGCPKCAEEGYGDDYVNA